MKYIAYTNKNLIDEKSFEQIWRLLEISFDINELRTKEEFKSLLALKYFKILATYDGDALLGVFFLWDVESFAFIENFAVDPQKRNVGIGMQMLEYLKVYTKKLIVLEVEPIVTSMQERRVNFYKRNGFVPCGMDYIMPALRINTEPLKLNLMSYPRAIADDEFENINESILNIIYKGKHI